MFYSKHLYPCDLITSVLHITVPVLDDQGLVKAYKHFSFVKGADRITRAASDINY